MFLTAQDKFIITSFVGFAIKYAKRFPPTDTLIFSRNNFERKRPTYINIPLKNLIDNALSKVFPDQGVSTSTFENTVARRMSLVRRIVITPSSERLFVFERDAKDAILMNQAEFEIYLDCVV
jgi:hypothetical protein